MKSMVVRLASCVLSLSLAATAQESPDVLVQATKEWLKNNSLGNRKELNASMDHRFLATTPAGDVLAKERLVPTDFSKPVQKLPRMELEGPIARFFDATGVVMSRLKSAEGRELNGTFVFLRADDRWKLAAVHLSPR